MHRSAHGLRPGPALLLLLLPAALPAAARAQLPTGVALGSADFRPTASYEMDVRLDPAVHQVSGTEILTFRNNTRRPTPDLWFHAYYNAWKNDASTWLRGRGSLPAEVDPERLGWIQVTRAELLPNMFYTADDLMESFAYIQPDDGNPWDQTLFRLRLPAPLPPGGEVIVRIDFTSHVPRTFARTGYIGDHYFLAQWFPKVGVLTDAGWRARQYFPVEYFAPFGTYDVRLTVPSDFVVAATGEAVGRPRVNADGTTTHRYRQEMVHDFAWTGWPHYLVFTEDYEFLPGYRTEITLLLSPEHKGLKERYLQAVRHALHYYSEWFGPYPYTTATCVDPAYNSGAGGMEYPTFFTGGAPLFAAEGVLRPEGVTIHEFGHQFWYGLVANNETDDGWMDEGFNSYSEARVQDVAYGPGHESITVFRLPLVFPEVAIPHRWAAAPGYRFRAKDVPLSVPSYLQGAAYGANAYNKAELMHWTLEGYLGWATYREVLATYQMRWSFRHPAPADYFEVVDEVSGMEMGWFFDQVFGTADVLDYAVGGVETRPVRAPHGITSRPPGAPEGGPPWAPEGIEVPAGMVDSEVTVRRLGEVTIPVEVLVVFADGEEVLEHWDGLDRSEVWTYRRPEQVVRVVVDPQEKLVLDVERTNNSWVRRADHRGSWKLTLRWMFWLQSLLEFFAFIS
jgi:hypothetical protein